MELLFFSVSLLASVIGAICGIGGGVIIKPVLDATGAMGVSTANFLSGCTVLSMSIISVFKSFRNRNNSIELRKGTLLAIGAAIGGLIGKDIFQLIYNVFPDKNKVGAIQASVLIVITVGTLIYTLKADRIKTHNINNLLACIIIGLVLGFFSAFLGIGGGPINIVVLSFFFSMGTKQAAANSLYIIMFSQLASLSSTVFNNNIPEFSIIALVLMITGGVLGGMIGGKINKKIESKTVDKLFAWLMVVIIFINMYNIIRLSGIQLF
jgi:uncharacterized membrane protein YfcA